MDEAKFREDALKAQVNCFEKENNALKERKKSVSVEQMSVLILSINVSMNLTG